MENSKRFSSAISSTSIPTAALRRQCQALFLEAGALGLTAIDLDALSQEAAAFGTAELAACFLMDRELSWMRRFASPKRKLEWLGGRIAAKTAIRSLLSQSCQPPWHDLEITAAASGQPGLSSRTFPKQTIDLSISHSGALAAAFCCTSGYCGLDIQKITPTVDRVKERFASAEEIAILGASKQLAQRGTIAALTLLWTAKEAFRKAARCTPLLGFLEVQLTGLTETPGLGLTGHFRSHRDGFAAPLLAQLSLHQDYACAITALPAGG